MEEVGEMRDPKSRDMTAEASGYPVSNQEEKPESTVWSTQLMQFTQTLQLQMGQVLIVSSVKLYQKRVPKLLIEIVAEKASIVPTSNDV